MRHPKLPATHRLRTCLPAAAVAAILAGCSANTDTAAGTAAAPTQPFAAGADPAANGSGPATPQEASNFVSVKLNGGWVYIHGTDQRGRYVCSIALFGRQGPGEMVMFAWRDRETAIDLTLHKASWNIPQPVQPPVRLVVPGAAPLLGHAFSRQNSLDLSLRAPVFAAMFIETTVAGRMQINFPGGNEPAWNVGTTGLPQASLILQGCIAERRKTNGDTQPFATGPSQAPAPASPSAVPRRSQRPRSTSPQAPLTQL